MRYTKLRYHLITYLPINLRLNNKKQTRNYSNIFYNLSKSKFYFNKRLYSKISLYSELKLLNIINKTNWLLQVFTYKELQLFTFEQLEFLSSLKLNHTKKLTTNYNTKDYLASKNHPCLITIISLANSKTTNVISDLFEKSNYSLDRTIFDYNSVYDYLEIMSHYNIEDIV